MCLDAAAPNDTFCDPSTHISKAIAELPSALSSSNASHHLQGIQAEILIARHFFKNGRLLEGRYHSDAAAAAALACGLHRMKSDPPIEETAMWPEYNSSDRRFGSGLTLPPARDTVEFAERVNVFWAAYTLDLCWSVALDLPPAIPYDTIITTSLPVEWGDLENVRVT